MLEERKLVTVVFVDIVGSTALGGKHDPEVVRATLGRAFSAMSKILQAHGGTVEKFIGDAVMAVFGVPTAHDDDADRAVRAAFAIRDRLADLNLRGGLQLEIRIGIDSGEAVAGGGQDAQNFVTGAVVNSAARMQSSAAPGEILVGALTRRLTHDGVGYAEPRTIDAKGIGQVDVWPAGELLSTVPEQHRGLPGLRARLIGRDRELRRLVDAYAELHERGAPHLVTVFGPPGSGKSRLASEFVAAIGAGHVRWGRCLPYGEAITYHAVQLIVRADAGIGPSDSADTAIRKVRAAARAAFSDRLEDADAVASRVAVISDLARAEDELPSVTPTDLHQELRWGLRHYLERRAVTSPLVLVFEDIHWAEPRLLDVIADLAESSRAPLLLLCSARPEFRDVAPTWGSDAARATAIDLSPLSTEDTRDLIAELLVVDALPDPLRADVVRRAEGNPLFVEEFLRMLIETGGIEKRDGRWSTAAGIAAIEVPPTLQALITARLDGVSPELKRLLQRGSLAGRLFSSAALAALGGAPPDPALLREAVRRDLLVETSEPALGTGQVFQFSHVLISDVAYSTMPKSERSQLHDRYGRWLEDSLADRRTEIAEIITHHAEQAYEYARQLDAPDARSLGRRALDLLFAAARNALERDDVLGASDLFRRAQAVAALVGATPGELAEARGYLVILARRIATDRRPIGELDEAIALARTAGPSALLVELLGRRGYQSHQFGSSGTAFVRESLAVARATNDAELVGEAMVMEIVVAYAEGGDVAESQRLLDEALAYVKGTDARRSRGELLAWGSRLATYRGDLAQAAYYRDEAVATLGGSTADRGRAALTNCAFDLDVGDIAAAVAHGRDALALVREVGLPLRIAECCLGLGEALLAAGESAAARDTLVEGLGIAQRRGRRGLIPELAARAARACARLGDIAAARAYAETAHTTAQPTDAEARSIAGVALGEVSEAEGDLAAAEVSFRSALASLEPTGLLNARAYTREAYAEFLLRHGRAAEARTELEAAREFHRDPMAFRHRERIDALLARTQVSA